MGHLMSSAPKLTLIFSGIPISVIFQYLITLSMLVEYVITATIGVLSWTRATGVFCGQ